MVLTYAMENPYTNFKYFVTPIINVASAHWLPTTAIPQAHACLDRRSLLQGSNLCSWIAEITACCNKSRKRHEKWKENGRSLQRARAATFLYFFYLRHVSADWDSAFPRRTSTTGSTICRSTRWWRNLTSRAQKTEPAACPGFQQWHNLNWQLKHDDVILRLWK